MTRDKEDKYLMAIADKVSHENENLVIRLFISSNTNETEFTALSKLLVDLNYCQYIDGEENNELSLFMERKIDDSNEESTDYLERLEEEMTNNFCKDFILKNLGLNENEDIDYESSASGVRESRLGKTLRRLKQIKNKNQNETEEDSSDAEDEHKKIEFPVYDTYNSVDPSAPIRFVDSDSEEELHSDEDALFEEEELS